jgi:hypothetical protein
VRVDDRRGRRSVCHGKPEVQHERQRSAHAPHRSAHSRALRDPSPRPRGRRPSCFALRAGCRGCGRRRARGAARVFPRPKAGRRRRHTVRDRALSRMRRGERRAVVRARRAESHAVGIARRTFYARRRQREPLDDVTLAHKVESQLYRHGVPKARSSSMPRTAWCSCVGSWSGPRTSSAWRPRRGGSRECAGREPGPRARHAGAGQPAEARTAAVRPMTPFAWPGRSSPQAAVPG